MIATKSLELLLSESQQTLRHQLASIERTDEKASKLISWMLVLAGLVLTPIQYFGQFPQFNESPHTRIWLIFGVLLLVAAISFSARVIRSTKLALGADPEVPEVMENVGWDHEKFLRDLLSVYGQMLRTNLRTQDDGAFWFNLALVALLLAIASFIVATLTLISNGGV